MFRRIPSSGRRADAFDLEERLEAHPHRAGVFLRRLGARTLGIPGRFLWVLPDGRGGKFVVEQRDRSFYVQNAVDWVHEVDVDELFPQEEERFNREFWEFPNPLFHNTRSSRWKLIQTSGLVPMAESRGISNRSTGPAVFLTDEEQAEKGTYGSVVLRVDTAAMKRASLMPFVAEEAPHREYELRGRLARMLGLDIEFDLEWGIDPATVVMFGPVPPQFLSRVS